MNWNESQRSAIEDRGRNILVSAAAGSGKTAVLVERIRRLVVEEGVPVDRFLIVTFTKAAASEMKEKIIKALNQEAMDADGNRLKMIRRQLNLIQKANISTFHGFALEILRRYFYVTDLEPGFKICDDAQGTILRMKAMDQVFASAYEKGEESFYEFLSCYSSDRNDMAARDMVQELYTMIMSIPKPFEWLDEMVLRLKADSLEESSYALFIYEDTKAALDKMRKGMEEIGRLYDEAGAYHLGGKFHEACSLLDETSIDEMSFEALRSFVNTFTFPARRTTKAEKDLLSEELVEETESIRKSCRKSFEAVKELYFLQEPGTILEDLQGIYPMAEVLSGLVKEFHKEFSLLKRKKGYIDFNDIEHYALEILRKEPKAAQEYRDKFEYIFIDEYQDSNDVQETLIGYIRREDNLFMVGDVKQSIYKFRLAEPEIFMEKYHAYGRDEEEKSIRIDLNENYRSKQGVVDAVNEIFMERMEGYDEANALHKGMAYDGSLQYPAELVLLDTAVTEDMDVDQELAELKSAELQAKAAVLLVKKSLGMEIYDAKKDTVRRASFRDMVILLRSTKNTAAIYAKAFEEAGIPSFLDESEGYFDTIEISMIENLLMVIDNFMQDIPLLSVLYSPIFDFTIEEMMDIRTFTPKAAYSSAFRRYMAYGEDQALKEKCRQCYGRIEDWRRLARSIDLGRLVWSLIWDTGYYLYAGALPGGSLRQANLRALADRAEGLKDQGISDLYSFLGYIRAIREKNVTVGQVKTASEDEDVVRIMTVHKSKGLEFPIVIAASSDKRFNTRRKSRNLTCHKRIGFAMPRVNAKEHWRRKTVAENIIERVSRLESLEEEKRILYVEYTRAQDMLYILAGSRDIEKKLADSRMNYSGEYASPLDYVLGRTLEAGSSIRMKTMNLTGLSMDLQGKEVERNPLSFEEETEISDEVRRRMEYVYPDRNLTEMKYKYSVSELGRSEEEDDLYEISLQKPSFLQEKKGFTAAERGTITHRAMQYIDFGCEDIDEALTILTQKGIFTLDEAEAVNRAGIRTFLDSSLGIRARSSSHLKKEQPFTMMDEKDGIPVMVQGIIDCYFEEPDGLVLIDYKNSNVKGEEILRDRYQVQIDLYARALEAATGKKVKERYLYLLKDGRAMEI